MAQDPSRRYEGTMGWFLQESFGPAQRDVAGIRRRGFVRWLDRWAAEDDRCEKLHDPVHTTHGKKQLERDQYWAGSRTHAAWPDATGGQEGIQATGSRQTRHLLLRKSEIGDVGLSIREAISIMQESVGIF